MTARKPSYPARDQLPSRVATSEAGAIDDLAATTLDRPVVDTSTVAVAAAPPRKRASEPPLRVTKPRGASLVIVVGVLLACTVLGLLTGALIALLR